MNDNKANLRKLDEAINSLNGDAEGMHSLIERSTDELERATDEVRKAADVAGEALGALSPLTQELESTLDNAQKLLTETGGVINRLESDMVRAREADRDVFRAFVAESQESARKARESDKEAFEAFASESRESSQKANEELTSSLVRAQESGKEAFEEFASSSLRASEKTRDDLQTDLLAFKTSMAARMDSIETTTEKRLDDLEGAVGRLEESMKGVEASFGDRVDMLQKKVSLPLYGIIAVAVLQLLTLAALFLK